MTLRESERMGSKAAIVEENDIRLDKIKGCMIGGAAGDALGYEVEFLSEQELFSQYGAGGIQEYALSQTSGKALISDDTQMTLFTANGILVADTQRASGGSHATPHDFVAASYQDWLSTQLMSYEEWRSMQHTSYEDCRGMYFTSRKECRERPRGSVRKQFSWLADVSELYASRAPGNTCLTALMEQRERGIAAITHGHSLGYMPAAVLVYIIRSIVYPEKQQPLKEIVLEARDIAKELFTGDGFLVVLADILDRAVALSENNESDPDNIHQLGEGWEAEETLGIAVYCSLRHADDFSAGIIAAVNHEGDSDSTGAVTGNILGALLGYNAIEEKWKKDLELADVIMEMSEDLYRGCRTDESGHIQDPDWIWKYI